MWILYFLVVVIASGDGVVVVVGGGFAVSGWCYCVIELLVLVCLI